MHFMILEKTSFLTTLYSPLLVVVPLGGHTTPNAATIVGNYDNTPGVITTYPTHAPWAAHTVANPYESWTWTSSLAESHANADDNAENISSY